MPIEFEIPRDLTDGAYQLYVMDWDSALEQDRMLTPFRYTAETTDEMFAVLRDVFAVRKNAVYVRLLRQADGVAVGRAAMPRLPSSRRQILLGAGQSNVSAFVSSAHKVVATEHVMDGSAVFTLSVARDAKVEGVPAKPARGGEGRPPAAPRTDDPKPRPNAPAGADADAQ